MNTVTRLLIFVVLFLSGAAMAQSGRVNVGFIYPEPIQRPLPNEFDHSLAGKEGRRGAELAGGRFGSLAQQHGWDLRILFASAPDGSSAVRAARRLVEHDGVVALIGGFSDETALALSEYAATAAVPFFNVGSTARAGTASDLTFNVHPDARTLLAGLLSGDRATGSIYVIAADDDSGASRLRTLYELLEGDDKRELAGQYLMDPAEPVLTGALREIQELQPDVLLLLLDWRLELDALGMLDVALTHEPLVLALPDSVSSTRYFYGIVRNASLKFGHGVRIAPWEHTAPGAAVRDVSDRYEGRFGEPFDPVAWTSYAAVQAVYEAVREAGAADPAVWAPPLAEGSVALDTGKDSASGFRNGELVQSLFLVEVHAESTGDSRLARLRDRAGFVAQLPPAPEDAD